MKNINKRTVIFAAVSLVIGLLLGWLIFGGTPSQNHDHDVIESRLNEIWTCSMHPSIRANESGQCPICGMDLIQVKTENNEDNPMAIQMSPSSMKLANVQTASVKSETPIKEVRLNGKIQTDEMNVFTQTSHIAGRVEVLRVNFTGEYVNKGQVIAQVYSPDLVTSQKELLEAYKIKESQPELYQASREKLANWKLTTQQIDQILKQGKPREQLPIFADVSGVVIKKTVNLGDYIKRGSALYEIADLSKLWVLFDVYESDIPWIKVGSNVTYTIQSIPGETFQGKVDFIDPVINPVTRVAKARILVRNKNLRLKPEMFVSGQVKASISNEARIIIPKSAVMWTGKRSVVYVKLISNNGLYFIMREVTLGPSLGPDYIISDGLEEGEEIAVNGTFSIDAAAQLAGKPSMMNPDGGTPIVHDHGSMPAQPQAENLTAIPADLEISNEVSSQLDKLVASYIELKNALVNDDFKKASEGAAEYWNTYKVIKMGSFKGSAHTFWMNEGAPLEDLAKKIRDAENIEAARVPFKPLSSHMVNLVKAFQPLGSTIFVQFCPMADGFKGANWLSYEANIYNPYFGASMLTCGEVTDTIGTVTKPTSNVKSPKMEVMANIGNNHIHIDHSSPRVRGRVIFGGLIPYNEVWSTGAHKATAVSFSKAVKIDGKIIPPGKYGLFTIPGKDNWIIILNKNWDQHLADEYAQKDDILRINVKPRKETKSLEELTFKVTSIDQNKGKIHFQWAETSFEILIENI